MGGGGGGYQLELVLGVWEDVTMGGGGGRYD